MLKPGRYDRDIRQPAAEGWSFAEKSFVSQELDEAHPKDASVVISGLAYGGQPDKATLNSFNDPRRVKVTCLSGSNCWDGTPHATTDYLLEGMYKAEHSQHSKSDTTVSSVIINKYEEGKVTLDRTYPGNKHNVSFSIRSKLATTIQLQYGVFTDEYLKPTWVNCGSTSVEAGGQVFINSGEIVLTTDIPPMIEFRLLVSESTDHLFEIYHDSKYHTGFVAYRTLPLIFGIYQFQFHYLAKQNYYSSVIPGGWTETNMPIHLATRMRVAGAPEHFTGKFDGKSHNAGIGNVGMYGDQLGYEGDQAPVVDPINYYEAEINQPKEVFDMGNGKSTNPTYGASFPNDENMNPYTKLYLKDIGFRNYSGITSPGQMLLLPETSSHGVGGYPNASLYIFRYFFATADRVAIWTRIDSDMAIGSFSLRLYSVNDLNEIPNFDQESIDEKCTLVGSAGVPIGGGMTGSIFQPNSSEKKMYLVGIYGTRLPLQSALASTTIVITTPATPPLFDVLNIKGAVDPSKLLLENGLRWTNSITLENYDDYRGFSASDFHKPEISYTSQPIEATFPFTPMGNGHGFTTTTMCCCFTNPQLPGISGDYFYVNCDVETVGGTAPGIIYGHGCSTWDGGTVSRDEVGGWRTRTNGETGYYVQAFQSGLVRPNIGRTWGTGFPMSFDNVLIPGNLTDTYTKNGVPIYVYVTVNTSYFGSPPTGIKIKLLKIEPYVFPIEADGSELNYFACTSFTAPTSGTYEVEAWGEKNTYITSKNLNNLNDAVMKLKTDTCQYLANGTIPQLYYGTTIYFAAIKNKADWDSYIPDDQTVYDFLILDSFEDGLPESKYKNKHIRYDSISQKFIEIRMPGMINEKTCVNFDIYDSELRRFVRKSYGYNPLTKKIELRTKKDSIKLEAGETVYTRVVNYAYTYNYRTTQNHRRITFTPDEPISP